jgi:hypothetical protein
MSPYSTEIETQMIHLYWSLSEKDRRRYAAVEAAKLGQGGMAYVAQLFQCDPNTIRHGKADLERLPEDGAAGRVRKKLGRQKQLDGSGR